MQVGERADLVGEHRAAAARIAARRMPEVVEQQLAAALEQVAEARPRPRAPRTRTRSRSPSSAAGGARPRARRARASPPSPSPAAPSWARFHSSPLTISGSSMSLARSLNASYRAGSTASTTQRTSALARHPVGSARTSLRGLRRLITTSDRGGDADDLNEHTSTARDRPLRRHWRSGAPQAAPGPPAPVEPRAPRDFEVVGTSLEPLTDDQFRQLAREACQRFGHGAVEPETIEAFVSRLTYVSQSAGPEGLAAAVEPRDGEARR